MRKLVSYICTKCGAALNIESSQEAFDCPFCGNVFDFTDIHYRELMSDAQSALRHMEFVAAKKKFDEVLESKPQDFDALQGIVLCALELRSENSLRDINKLKNADFKIAKLNIAFAAKQASEKDVPYFTKLAEMIEAVNQYNMFCTEQASWSDAKWIECSDPNLPYTRSRHTEQLKEYDEKKARTLNEINQALAFLNSYRSSENGSGIASSSSFVPRNTTNNIPSSETDNGITCYMCAGKLRLDNKHKFYRCDHCGVAYGSSLFTGNLLENALNAMDMNEFFEADLNCQFELVIHPQNAQAHRLRILCAIKQTSFANLEGVPSISNHLLMRMHERAAEAMAKVSKYDAVYFRQFLALANLYSRNVHIASERLKLNKDQEHSLTELDSYSPYYESYSNKLTRYELNVTRNELNRLSQQEADVRNLIRCITELEIARNYIYPRR